MVPGTVFSLYVNPYNFVVKVVTNPLKNDTINLTARQTNLP